MMQSLLAHAARLAGFSMRINDVFPFRRETVSFLHRAFRFALGQTRKGSAANKWLRVYTGDVLAQGVFGMVNKLIVLASRWCFVVLLVIVCWTAGFKTAKGQETNQEEQNVARARLAETFLQTHCYRCHGEGGMAEGGLNDILDRNRLVQTKLIALGDAAKSPLWQRVHSGEMPADDVTKPSDAEMEALRDWIANGAPDFKQPIAERQVITLEQINEYIANDQATFSGRVALRKRYITLTHLYNQNRTAAEMDSYKHALAKFLNSVSWGSRILPLEPIDPQQTIFRIDLSDLQWSNAVWNKILSRYPYAEEPEGVHAEQAAKRLRTRGVAIRGDWFVATASRPPLYHEILEIPETDVALERRIGVDVARNYLDERFLRAGFNRSGVSQNNRLIERHDSPYGGYWKSFDFASNAGQQNLFANPIGPGKGEKLFKHDGGELIFSLPNGLQGYMLVDQNGQRIDKGPTAIVSDPSRPDRAVENGISCMGCHARGMIRKDDQILSHVTKNPESFSDAERFHIFTVFRSAEFKQALQRDAERFEAAVKACGVPFSKTEPVLTLVQRYEEELDLAAVSAELGVTTAEFRMLVNQKAELARFLGSVLTEGGTLQREVLEKSYAELVQTAGRRPLFREHTNFDQPKISANRGIRDNAMLFTDHAFHNVPTIEAIQERGINLVIETLPEPPAEVLAAWTQADRSEQYRLAVELARQRFVETKATFVLLIIDSRITGPIRVLFGDNKNYSTDQRDAVIVEFDALMRERQFDSALQSFLRQIAELKKQ
jgi:mono/diheme cytochrome c family protein